ncbi:MAG TPA: hydantoinase/oxoprolinase family protein [Solirubrobacteraceae bacterium]|nr:hydantoinase/oxoprolinase family protein [Solirubrobacteraceae bacterium]
MRLGVDVGGTFTDAVLNDGQRLHSAKAPTTPRDQSQGVLSAVERVLAAAGAQAQQVDAFLHGMTVATNALLEGRCARTAFVATEGFEDLIALGRQQRPHLYRLCEGRPAPLSPPERRFGAPERMSPEGPVRPLSAGGARAVAEAVAGSEPEAVAVALLHSYRHPEHELALGAALAQRLPGAHVSLSHQVCGTFREFERAATTEIDAALSPLLAGYLRALADRCRGAGLPVPMIMQSNGGLADLGWAAGHAAWTVLSGPAAGAAAAAQIARASGAPEALCFDMGGTSCDVCVVEGGTVAQLSGGSVAGRPLALPMLEVHTVGAGGGSIAWRDSGGALRVGPSSAGADPGPACYGRGGSEPTVTDANLVLGRLSKESELAGGVRLDADAALRAVGGLGRRLGLDPIRCAEGIVQVANAEMVRAMRVLTVQRGIDPRTRALLAFGGAGPLHAVEIATELQISRVLCPRASGVLAALGLVAAPSRRDVARTVMLSGAQLDGRLIAAHVEALGERARLELGQPGAELQAVYELRYRGQSFELAIEGPLDPSPAWLREAFEAAHEERYGHRDPDAALELVTIRLSATVGAADVPLAGAGERRPSRGPARPVVIDGRRLWPSIVRGGPAPGQAIAGPAIIELPESTVLVAPGWDARVDDAGTIDLRRRPR